MSNITDLNGLVALQKEYLKLIESNPVNPDLDLKITKLQSELESAYASLETANVSSNNVLTHQREIELNDSYQKKQAEYNKIKYAWVMALAISVILVISKKNFEFLPSFMFDVLTILVLFGASIYTISILIEVSRREKINFNKLDLPDPAARTAAELQAAAKAASKEEGGDLLGGMNLYGCVGSYCCSPGTKWENDISKCVHDDNYTGAGAGADEKQPFTTMPTAKYGNKRRININNVKENYANEYDNYSKV